MIIVCKIETAVDVHFSLFSGVGAQEGRQQQAVLPGGGAPPTWTGRRQDAGTDGAEAVHVELHAQAQIRPGRSDTLIKGFLSLKSQIKSSQPPIRAIIAPQWQWVKMF